MPDESTREILFGIRADVRTCIKEIDGLRKSQGRALDRISKVDAKHGAATAVINNRLSAVDSVLDKLDQRLIDVGTKVAAIDVKATKAQAKAQGIEDGDKKAARRAALMPGGIAGGVITIGGGIVLFVLYGLLHWLGDMLPGDGP